MKALQAKLREIDKQVEAALEQARTIESQGEELPKNFWDHMDNCIDELNSAKMALVRAKK